jgi:hypothetical protein
MKALSSSSSSVAQPRLQLLPLPSQSDAGRIHEYAAAKNIQCRVMSHQGVACMYSRSKICLQTKQCCDANTRFLNRTYEPF